MIPWSWLTPYQRRRALGLCTWTGCGNRAVKSLCQLHRKKHGGYEKVNRRERYLLRKSNSMCVIDGCKESADETNCLCKKHKGNKARNDRALRDRRPEERRKQVRDAQKRIRDSDWYDRGRVPKPAPSIEHYATARRGEWSLPG